MPPSLKPKRADVTPEAVEWIKIFWRDAYTRMSNNLAACPPYARRSMEDRLGVPLNRIRSAFINSSAFDEQLTSLRSLPYTEITAEEHYTPEGPVSFLVAHTQVIRIQEPIRYNLGTYTVYIPAGILSDGVNADHLNFVPDKNPHTAFRHPHHIVRHRYPAPDPIAAYSKICWGGFGEIMTKVLSDGDVVELLRNIDIFLRRHDPKSPLCLIESVTHAVREVQ